MTRGERNCEWIERYCRVPEGKDVGKPVVLRPWQRQEICRIYDNPHGTRLAILSFARKNAKTTLCGFLLLLHLVGPESVLNSQLFSAARSRDQAAVLFALAAKIIRFSPELAQYIHIRESAKELICGARGTWYKALSAEVPTAHGKSPVFLIHDELGQVRGPRDELYDVLETATGAHEAPLSIVISTQAKSDADLLSILIDDAQTGADPHTIVSLYTAPPEDELSEGNPDGCDPFSDEHIAKANPAFGDFLNADKVRRDAEKARRLPSNEASFRNLVLNQRVDAVTPFVTIAAWKGCTGPAERPDFGDLEVYGGIDLSSVSDLTAKIYTAESDGVWFVDSTFWLPEEGLRDRASNDRQPYDVWHDQELLDTTPGRTVDYAVIARTIWEDCQRWNVRKIGYDAWQFTHLRRYLEAEGFRDYHFEGDDPLFVPMRQGFITMSPALRTLEADILDGKLAHGGHPVLTMCAANVAVVEDDAGNRKFSKRRSTGRIDGMVALAMARAIAETNRAAGPSVYAERGALVL